MYICPILPISLENEAYIIYLNCRGVTLIASLLEILYPSMWLAVDNTWECSKDALVRVVELRSLGLLL